MEIFLEAVKSGWYALLEYLSAHVLTCLVPAFFIAGAIAVFVSKGAILKYFGPKAKRWLSYSVASVSGAILAVCSCTILPLFAGIRKRGAGLGPAIAFLYSGPAINILAIVYTARLLGYDLGVARAIGAIIFSIVIGLIMSLIWIKEERKKLEENQDLFKAY
ncbi:MAG: permease, partial [Actinobacteria bacterium]|nr:permease [Actinomycetota bacterium]